jgi:hypothetical protein
MNTLFVENIGLMAPGLAGWLASRGVLTGEQPYSAEPMPAAIATLLPTNERRRTTATVKLALQVAQEAMAQGKMQVHTVLASSGGDSEVLDKICVALTEPDRPVSPTQFHHSVHNTPAGYWAIATGCTLPSLSLSAYDGSFAAGLREAAALAWMEMAPVLLIAYDLPLPFPLSERRLIVEPFAVALLLNPEVAGPRLAMLRFNRKTTGPATSLENPLLEALRLGNPAARSLPLLCAIARQQAQGVALPVVNDEFLPVEIEP